MCIRDRYRSEGGLNGYTYGMDVFGKEEMEVLNTDAEPEELRDFLASLASYVPVSYTHLDVYKRQAYHLRWRWRVQYLRRAGSISRFPTLFAPL